MNQTAVIAVALLAGVAGDAVAEPPTAHYKILDSIAGPDGRWDFARIDAAHHRLLVTRTTSLMTVDLRTNKVTAGLAPGQRLHDAVPVNGDAEVLVTRGGSDDVVFVNTETWRQVAALPAGKDPDAAGLDPATGLVLVMNHQSGDVTLVDPKAHKVAGRIQVAGDLEMAAFDGKRHAFVNVEDKNEVAVIDMTQRKVVGHFKLPGCDGPTGLAYYEPRRWLVAACDGGTAVVDATSGRSVAALKTGLKADGVAVDSKRRVAFVPGRDGTLSVISLGGLKPKVVQVLKTGPNNRTLALDEETGRVYLPSAELQATKDGERAQAAAGTFKIVIVGP